MSGAVTPISSPTKGPNQESASSPPPAYIHTPPIAAKFMSVRPTFDQRQSSGQAAHGSGSSETTSLSETSSTAVGSTIHVGDHQQHDENKPLNQTYQEWYPGDASHNGRPAWWNRFFCCGYGLGCLLCPCGSWTCKQERL